MDNGMSDLDSLRASRLLAEVRLIRSKLRVKEKKLALADLKIKELEAKLKKGK